MEGLVETLQWRIEQERYEIVFEEQQALCHAFARAVLPGDRFASMVALCRPIPRGTC